jgi:hypothetical protein
MSHSDFAAGIGWRRPVCAGHSSIRPKTCENPSMYISPRSRTLTMVCFFVASLSPALAQEPMTNGAAPAEMAASAEHAGITGKERLGEKWTDEQRTDNCKVPLGKRGSKPRPDTCPAVSAK